MSIKYLLENNKRWASESVLREPDFFQKLSQQQSPRYMWIGCSDSRVPANQITGLLPGEMFVHRNVANVVVHSDLNCLSTLQYAVDVLKVQDIIVCGHYGCGGVLSALRNSRSGLVDNWLRHVQDVHAKHREDVSSFGTEEERHNRLSELNVLEQVNNVVGTTVIRDAWTRGQKVSIHGWIYALSDGLVRELCSTSEENA